MTNLFKKYYTELITGLMKVLVESIKSQYNNITTYRLLIGSSYIKLPTELKSLEKGLINIKNNNQKCFLWWHIRHVNPVKIHPERINQRDKELVIDLNCDGIKLLVSEEHFSKAEMKNNICINVSCYKNKLTFPMYISDQTFQNSMNLLLIIDENKSHYLYVIELTDLCFTK